VHDVCFSSVGNFKRRFVLKNELSLYVQARSIGFGRGFEAGIFTDRPARDLKLSELAKDHLKAGVS